MFEIDSFMKKAFNMIDNADVVSFDIFDTLIVRYCTFPTDVFSYVELKSSLAGFKEDRIKAEVLARKNAEGPEVEEVTLDEIYNYLPKKYHKLKNDEISAEILFCNINKQFLPVYEYAIAKHKKIIIVSEMYLDQDTIEKILAKNGITYDHLYLSSTLFKKKTGKLFDHVLTDLKLTSPAQLLHFGDNFEGDIKPSQKLNFSTCHYISLYDQFIERNIFSDTLFTRIKESTYIELSFLIKICILYCMYHDKQVQKDYLHDLGSFFVWPSVMMFNNWLKKSCESDGIYNLCFLSRDGFLFKSVFDLIQNYNKKFTTKRLFVSRRALCFPVQASYDSEYHSFLYGLDDHTKYPLEIIASHFDSMSAELYDSLLEFYRYNGNNSITKQEYREFLLQNRVKIINEFDEQKKTLFEYFSNENIFSSKTAVIDIGWSGSMQRCIELLGLENGFLPDITGYYFGASHTCYLKKGSFHSFTSMSGLPYNLWELVNRRLVDLIELLFTVPKKSVRTLKKANGTIFPVYFEKITDKEKERVNFIKEVNAGLKDITNFYLTNNFNEVLHELFSLSDKRGAILLLEEMVKINQDYIKDIKVFYSHNLLLSKQFFLPTTDLK